MLWLGGLATIVFIFSKNRNDKIAEMSLLLFFSIMIPYLYLPRESMYLYYILPIIPLYAISLAYFVVTKYNNYKWHALAAITLLSLLLYPVAAGIAMPDAYFNLTRILTGFPIS